MQAPGLRRGGSERRDARSMSSDRSGDPVQTFRRGARPSRGGRRPRRARTPWAGWRAQTVSRQSGLGRLVLRSVHHKRGRIDRADQQVVAERIAEQCANRDEPVCGRGDVGDRRIGRIEHERANLLARGERDRNPGPKQLPEGDDALRRNSARDRRRIGRFAVELSPRSLGEPVELA